MLGFIIANCKQQRCTKPNYVHTKHFQFAFKSQFHFATITLGYFLVRHGNYIHQFVDEGDRHKKKMFDSYNLVNEPNRSPKR